MRKQRIVHCLVGRFNQRDDVERTVWPWSGPSLENDSLPAQPSNVRMIIARKETIVGDDQRIIYHNVIPSRISGFSFLCRIAVEERGGSGGLL